MGVVYLMLTILFESIAVIFMKLSYGFQHKLQAGVAVAAYILGFIFLTLSLKHLPVGFANAIWAGASTVLVAVLGVLIFHEKLSVTQMIFLSLIVIGLIGLNFSKH